DLDVGGDFLDAFLLAPNRVALVVGDVSGKGLAAAASTSEVKYTLRALLREYQDPAMALTRLSVHLLQSRGLESAPSGFLALALIVVDTAAGEATFAVGGMEAPLVVGRNQVVRQVEIGGLPLGVLPYARYVSTMERLGPGDLLVITTDGIVEARRGQDFFGHEGLAETVAAARHIPALNEIADCILNTASRFAGGELRDDTAILLARLRDCNG
ncbi:MAG TPA: PP2C family protein-serine/threonine phosphatase, partial [Capsulimonadaceae bacterium]|nr:PP2C family protein-serine/threonine phosphatase [Capsulimonadaceae bacterium]